ncbi:MAG: hypothetical protein Q8P89_01030 [bacterium]|nr:hypothetical protein [bacterium]
MNAEIGIKKSKKEEGGAPKEKNQIACFFEAYGKYVKNIALLIAIGLTYSVLTNTDQIYTNLAVVKGSMLKLFWVAVLVGFYLGGTPAALKTAAVLAMTACLMFVFVQKTPWAIANKAIDAFRSNPVSTASVNAVSAGKSLAIDLQPNQIYDIDNLTTGQNWRYLSFNGTFSHRIDKGDGKACWKVVDNNLPWSADYTGKLQVKAGNTPVKLAVNVL